MNHVHLSPEDLAVEFECAVARYMRDVRAALDAFESDRKARDIEDFVVKVQAWEAAVQGAAGVAPHGAPPSAPSA